MFATDVTHTPASFHRFQDRNDLRLTELASLHQGLLRAAMLPRKPLLFNGPVFREGYKLPEKDVRIQALEIIGKLGLDDPALRQRLENCREEGSNTHWVLRKGI
jgi:hypothetical protein